MEAAPPAPSRSATPLLTLLALTALAAALAHAGVLPRAAALPGAALALAGGAVLPLLLRAAPAEPSPLKLWAFGALLSPPLVAVLLLAGQRAVGPERALVATFSLLALLPLAGRGRRLGGAPLGGAAWAAVLLGVGAAGTVALVLLGGGEGALLLRPEVLWHSGVADMWLRAGPLEHPWFAGGDLPASPAVGLLVAAVAGPLGVAAPVALALLVAASALLVTVLVYLTAAAVWRGPARDLGATLLALLAGNVPGGLLAAAPPAPTDAGPVGWSAGLAALTTGPLRALPDQLDYAGSALLRAGALPLALAFVAGALAAGVHAVRHGARPWPALAALSGGLAALVHPPLGVAVVGALIAAGFLAPGRPEVRLRLAPLAALALLPAVASVARFGLTGDPASPVPRPASAAALLGPLAVLAVAALGLAAARRPTPSGDRPTLALLGLAAVAPVALAFALPDGLRASAALAAAALLPLGILAAGGVGALLLRGGPPRALGLAIGLLLGAGVARSSLHGARLDLELARVGAVVRTAGARVVPADPRGVDRAVAECYAWIAAQPDLARRRAVLVRGVGLGSARLGGPSAPHLAPLATDLPLWWDAPRRLAVAGRTRAGDDWKIRGDALALLFGARNDWDVRISRLFAALGRPLVFIVDEIDRGATTERGSGARGVDSRLLTLGARLVHDVGDAAVYLLEPEDLR